MTTYTIDLELQDGTTVQWVGSSLTGRYERASNAIRLRSWLALTAMVTAVPDIGSLDVTFDNAPDSDTITGVLSEVLSSDIQAVVSVRWRDSQRRGVGSEATEIPYRFSGVLQIALLTSRMNGDGVVTEAIDVLADALRWMDSGEIHYGNPVPLEGSPAAETTGSSGHGRFARTLEVPFWLDENNLRSETYEQSAETNVDGTAEVCRTRFRDLIETTLGIDVAYDNADPITPNGTDPFVALDVMFGTSETASLGATSRRYRTGGIMQAAIYVPAHTGDGDALAIADAIFDAFHSVNDRAVTFLSPAIRLSGRVGSHWRVVMDVPFTSEQIQ